MNSISTQVMTRTKMLCILLFLGTALLSSEVSKLPSQSQERTKVTEGEYLTHTDSPYDKKEQLREPWVLWRVSEGRYVVESDLRFENTTNKTALHQSLILSRDLRMEQVKTSSLTPPVNETDIQLASDEVRERDRHGESKLKVPPRYDFYFPLTPWSLSGLARRAGYQKGTGTPLIFTAVDEVGPEKPLGATMLWARAQCLGPEELDSAGQKFSAMKYIIHLGPYPGVFVWLSEEGLVLASQSEENSDQKTELIRLRKYEELPKLLLPPKQNETPRKD